MKVNSWVRLRGDSSGRRGRVLMLAERDENGCFRLVFVRWNKHEVSGHRPEELEVCEQ